jgi:TrmH family RNA methyltransferase
MGALFSLILTQTPWKDFKEWKRTNGISIVGTSDHAQADYQAVYYSRPLVLLMGSERHGLSPEMEATCDHMVRIPMEGRGDSLNLAVATAVVLYEIYNQSRNHVTIKS